MPNRNRQAGDYFERRTREAYEAAGWVVVRSAGSLGPADLVAMRPCWTPQLVACKTKRRISRAEVLALADAAERAGALAIVAWRESPGWVGRQVVSRHSVDTLDSLKMPVSKATVRRRRITNASQMETR